MLEPIALRIKRKIWKKILGEKSWVIHNGDFRAQERLGLINRPHHAYGLLRAADTAKYFGRKDVTVIEFGVASGAGLINLVELASQIEKLTGIRFHIIGFDTGKGLPYVRGHKDHPEIWNPGDFETEGRAALMIRLDGRARVIWGDLAETVDAFARSLSPDAPLGFISVDVDIYSSGKAALRVLSGPVENYLSAISIYFDDVGFFFANRWCGELAAISEFNDENKLRKIDMDRSVDRSSLYFSWHRKMHVCHMLDNPARQVSRDRNSLTIDEHLAFTSSNFV